jgi:hypothetical protein
VIEGHAVGFMRCIFGRGRSAVIASSFAGLFTAACGTSSSSTSSTSQGSATINGTVNGQSVAANDVIGLTGTEMKDASMNAYAAIIISNETGTCERAHSSVWDGSPAYEVLVIDAVVSGASSVGPGTYPVGNAGVAQLTVVHADGTTAGDAGDGTMDVLLRAPVLDLEAEHVDASEGYGTW